MATSAEILELERAFWQAMVDQEPAKAAALLPDKASMVAMYGVHHFSPAEYVAMAEQGTARVTGFSFSDEEVFFPIDDVAILTYKVRQSFEVDGMPQEMTCYDSTTWVKRDGKWLAAAHTETPEQQGKPA